MKWLTSADVQALLARHDYDVRRSNNARWIDQKCTPDVLTVVADCVLAYAQEHPGERFSASDIWHSPYTTENVTDLFRKPNPEEEKARSEYDKFFPQPMELLSYSGVLKKHKAGGRTFYTVAEEALLEAIALRDRNALLFLQLYIEKVLADSNLLPVFEVFFLRQDKAAFTALKTAFEDFTIEHTPINTRVECRRIFSKILNPLCFARNLRGTERGHLSAQKITYDMLVYNRDNFRDVNSGKSKEITRQEHEATLPAPSYAKALKYLSQRAKRELRAYNDACRDGRSEVALYDSGAPAVHMHHIFPEADFPVIAAYLENLIALTPDQHLAYAHPMGNTHLVDPAFQRECLLAKLAHIRENLTRLSGEIIYEFGRFQYMLSRCLDEDAFLEVEYLNFDGLAALIESHYC